MHRNRTFVPSTLLTLSLLAATACSVSDMTSPQIDASHLSTVANRFSYFSGTITIVPATATIPVGGTLALDGTIKSLSGVDLTTILGPQATVTSSDTTIATVTDSGVVTGISPGVATITAQLGAVTATSTITVGSGSSSLSATSVTLLPTTATLMVGSTLALNGKITGDNGADLTAALSPGATLTLDDSSIVSVSPKGIVTGLQSGVVHITAHVGAMSATSTITVVDTSNTGGSGGSTSSSGGSSGGSSSGSSSGGSSSSGSSAGSGSGVSGVALVSDDYSQYGSTAAFLANISSNLGGTGNPQTALYNDGVNAQLVTLDNTVTYNGHATAKYTQPAGTASTPELWVNFPGQQTLTSMWFRVKVRFSPGFSTTGTLTNSANAYKLLGWGWKGADGRGSIEITNTNQYQLYWDVLSSGSVIAGGDFAVAGNISREWTDGAWYDYVIHYQQTSSTSATAQTWIQKDGDTYNLRATSTGTGASLPGIGSVMLGINFNQVRTSSQSQAIWIGEWEVIDGSKYSNPFGIPGI